MINEGIENGAPMETMKKVALCSKLDHFWQEMLLQALGPIETIKYQDMVEEIGRTLELTFHAKLLSGQALQEKQSKWPYPGKAVCLHL